MSSNKYGDSNICEDDVTPPLSPRAELYISYGPLLPPEPRIHGEMPDTFSISENEFSYAIRGSANVPDSALPGSPGPNPGSQTTPNLFLDHFPRTPRQDLEGAVQVQYAARKRFLDDLNSYVPLGSVHAIAHDGYFESDEWEEQHTDDIIGIDNSSTKGLTHLWSLYREGLIRLFVKRLPGWRNRCMIRVYYLSDDVGRRWINRELGPSQTRRLSLKYLMNDIIDFSAKSWDGHFEGFQQSQFLSRCFTDPDRNDRLFYIFNTLTSPAPEDVFVNCPFSRDAVADVLNPSVCLAGLKTSLYPYQRRSVATMIRKEVQPARTLDPRLEILEGPVGNKIYYDEKSVTLVRDERTYEEPRGGILAETMGLGKTLICLSTMLATRGHWPRIPPEFSTNLFPVRHKVGKLVDMTAAAIARQQIPWRVYFQEIERNETCISILEEAVGSYTIVPCPTKHMRRPSIALKEQTIRLCPVTLVVVPVNLFHHWENEMVLHISKNALRVIHVRTLESPMPTEEEIIVSDIVLITKQRFEREMKPLDPSYESPLKNLHFLRIIVDEGHDFGSSSAGTNAMLALQKLHVDRRWIISGTPTTGLLGVEVDLAAKETSDGTRPAPSAALIKQRTGDQQERLQERKDLERLGRMSKDFFQLQPWANSKGDDGASWEEYVMPNKDGSRKLRSLRSILESLVVRHRLEDVERDVQLPALDNQMVYIMPTWHDKVSLNLFLLNLCINAVTSERVDQDYMFHPKNRGKLGILISNLRQAGFYWTGHEPIEMSKALEVSNKYRQNLMPSDQPISQTDIDYLDRASSIGKAALLSETWRNLSELNELGVYVDDFPADARKVWSLVQSDGGTEALLIAATHLAEAQKFVDCRLYASDPVADLAQTGENVLQSAWDNAAKRKDEKASPTVLPEEPKLLSRNTISRSKTGRSPRKKKNVPVPEVNGDTSRFDRPSPGMKPVLKDALNAHLSSPLPEDFPISKAKICGFASAKLTYLMDRVIALHHSEKIIIFYEGNNIAYYIAQALELIDIRYLIYTGTLAERRKAAYITTFNATENFRVMLMDLSQAAHGLHVASASRIFFVNPVWQPKIEAQAIKRAHRIGQTKPVYVETLVLVGTLEDEIRSRRKSMSNEEHQKAEKSLLDDEVMKKIIQDAKFIPMATEQDKDTRPFARLEEPQQLFGRVSSHPADPDADLIFPGEEAPSRQSPKKRAVPASPTASETPKKKKMVSFREGNDGD